MEHRDGKFSGRISEMRNRIWSKIVILLIVGMFALVSSAAFAAEKPWFVIKDAKGVCKVIQAKEKTPKTVAGPFVTKAEATKAKGDLCPKTDGKKEPAKKPGA
jgi:hypothetical protein